nr:MAG TPA: hypothetical protein [Caudoviricetes sp.]
MILMSEVLYSQSFLINLFSCIAVLSISQSRKIILRSSLSQQVEIRKNPLPLTR